MADVATTLTHNGVTYSAQIVTIEQTRMGREDHGCFQASLSVTWGGSATTIAGLILDGKPDMNGPSPHKRTATAFGMQWITEIIDTVLGEYGRWEDLPGKRIFMLHDQGVSTQHGFECKGIASLDGERVMIFDEVAARCLVRS